MKKTLTLLMTLLILSCNNNGKSSKKDSGNEGAEITSNTNSDSGSSNKGSEISITITGGPNAGIYHVTTKDETCSEGLTGENSFGNQYSENGKADNELSSLQMIIDDKNAAKQGTSQFSIGINFGKLFGGKSYSINTRGNSKEGSGMATLTESGDTKTVVVKGKTADGVSISATIKCNSMITAG